MSAGSVPARKAWTALVAGAITLGIDVLYVLILRSEGEGDLHRARAQLIAASLAGSAAIAFVGWRIREPSRRLAVLTLASFTLLAWGFLAMLTIGLPVCVAGILLLVSASRAADEVPTAKAYTITAGAALSALLLAGAILTTTS
jgi:hypothetical protein